MSLRKHFAVITLSAAAASLAFNPVVQAAALSIAAPAQTDGLTVLAATKAKAKPKKAKAGSCGSHMYWTAKSRKCMDARDKKPS